MASYKIRTDKKNTPKSAIVQRLLIEIDEDVFQEQEPVNQYIIARRPYINNEFISSSIIPIVMKHFFKSSELVLSFNPNHGIYKIKIADLLVDTIRNWEYNRPPCMMRCQDIARYIYLTRKPIDTMLHICFNNKSETFDVLDGIHRLTAMKIVKEENSKTLDLLCPGEFGSGNDAVWLYEQYMLVNIRFNASEGELIEVFKTLNKSQAVPELYKSDPSKEKRELIDAIANEWCVKYKEHFKSSENPNTNNTNRNKFVELLTGLYDKHNIRATNGNKLRTLLENANTAISQAIPSKATIDMRFKCKETGCYLFLYKNDKLLKMI